jgi:phosphatidylethanolamine-binding protein (PEBP) family uncharacterized protein
MLVMEDADAPSQAFRHWAVYDIGGDRRHVAEGRSSKARTEDLPHGFNDFGNLHYDGPDPRTGNQPHTYRFRICGARHAQSPHSPGTRRLGNLGGCPTICWAKRSGRAPTVDFLA